MYIDISSNRICRNVNNNILVSLSFSLYLHLQEVTKNIIEHLFVFKIKY